MSQHAVADTSGPGAGLTAEEEKKRRKQEKKDIALAMKLQKEETGQIVVGDQIEISRPGGRWVRGVAVGNGKKKTHFICRFEDQGRVMEQDFSRKALRPIIGGSRRAPVEEDSEKVMLETLREAIRAGMDPSTMNLSPEVLRQLGYGHLAPAPAPQVGRPRGPPAGYAQGQGSRGGAAYASSAHAQGHQQHSRAAGTTAQASLVEPVDCLGELVDMGVPAFQDIDTVIPENAYAGAAIELKLPTGERTRVALPAGVTPGQRVTLRVPAPEPDFHLVRFVVPPGKSPGSIVTISVPGRNAPFRVEVPPGVEPGMQIQAAAENYNKQRGGAAGGGGAPLQAQSPSRQRAQPAVPTQSAVAPEPEPKLELTAEQQAFLDSMPADIQKELLGNQRALADMLGVPWPPERPAVAAVAPPSDAAPADAGASGASSAAGGDDGGRAEVATSSPAENAAASAAIAGTAPAAAGAAAAAATAPAPGPAPAPAPLAGPVTPTPAGRPTLPPRTSSRSRSGSFSGAGHVRNLSGSLSRSLAQASSPSPGGGAAVARRRSGSLSRQPGAMSTSPSPGGGVARKRSGSLSRQLAAKSPAAAPAPALPAAAASGATPVLPTAAAPAAAASAEAAADSKAPLGVDEREERRRQHAARREARRKARAGKGIMGRAGDPLPGEIVEQTPPRSGRAKSSDPASSSSSSSSSLSSSSSSGVAAAGKAAGPVPAAAGVAVAGGSPAPGSSGAPAPAPLISEPTVAPLPAGMVSTGNRSADRERVRRNLEQLKEDYSNGTVEVTEFNRLRRLYLQQLSALMNHAKPPMQAAQSKDI